MDDLGEFLGSVFFVAIIILVVLLIFGAFTPEVKLCDDIAIMTGLETRVINKTCQLNVNGYFVDYGEWISKQGEPHE